MTNTIKFILTIISISIIIVNLFYTETYSPLIKFFSINNIRDGKNVSSELKLEGKDYENIFDTDKVIYDNIDIKDVLVDIDNKSSELIYKEINLIEDNKYNYISILYDNDNKVIKEKFRILFIDENIIINYNNSEYKINLFNIYNDLINNKITSENKLILNSIFKNDEYEDNLINLINLILQIYNKNPDSFSNDNNLTPLGLLMNEVKNNVNVNYNPFYSNIDIFEDKYGYKNISYTDSIINIFNNDNICIDRNIKILNRDLNLRFMSINNNKYILFSYY